MRLKKAAEIIALVALARLLAVAATDPISDLFQVGPLVNILYLPTGVAVVAMLVFGYWAAVGVALSGFIWTVLHHGFGFADSFLLAAARWGGCVLALGAFNIVARKWTTLGAQQLTMASVLVFVLMLSVTNSTLHHVAFLLEGEIVIPRLATLVAMMIGDALGAVVVFLLCNIATSAWLWTKRSGY